MCLAAGLGAKRRIACTQPRRVAALSVAKRVAEELKVDFGAEVGAKIRFNDQTGKRTRVKFMTDGMLLSEVQGDPLLREYDAIIIDEAHERSLNIDFLLGHLNQLRSRRPDLKIIITSATIDTEKFSQAFDGAPIVEVSGRVYPVEVIHAPLDELLEESGEFTYHEGIAESTQRIQDELGSGDILAFLPTEKDIREAMDLLKGRFGHRMAIVPCFGRLSTADQQRIFQPSPKRKLILATNIAETSLTIPGIRFVIDTGLARISRYNPRSRAKRLPIVKISQSSANQRKGRCGRVANGVCIRLYSEKDFESRTVHSVPEIQRANLADVILRMIASKLGDVSTFPFIDPPTPTAISAGYALLKELGALEGNEELKTKNEEPPPKQSSSSSSSTSPPPASTQNPAPRTQPNILTKTGRQLSKLPVDPTVGRMLLEAQRQGVTQEVLVIASAISIQDPRERPLEKEAAARQAHAQFNHPKSDFLALLNIWEQLHEDLERLPQSRLRKFCKSHFLSYARMREWRDIHEQLKRALRSPAQRDEARVRSPNPQSPEGRYQAIHQSLLSGLLSNAGRVEQTNLYRFPANRKPLVFPGSALFIRQEKKNPKSEARGPKSKLKAKGPQWIMAGEVVETSRLYARNVAAIDPTWLAQMGQHILTRSYGDPIFDPAAGRVLTRESLRIHGLEIQNKQVSYAKVDPTKATEIFIREALLNEDYEAPVNWTFLEPNRRLMRRIQNAQTVASVAHWMGVEEAAFSFYQKRLENVSSIHDLNKLLKVGSDGPADRTAGSNLHMQELNLTASDDAPIELSLFPETVELKNSALPLEYRYDPTSEHDGVTLKLPYGKAKDLQPAMLDWLVPGHLEAKVHALLKALPKPLRQRLVPLAKTAKTIAKELKPRGKTLPESLAEHLAKTYSLETYASDWDSAAIPTHLKARVEVVDQKGNTLAQGRDLESIHLQLEERQQKLSQPTEAATATLWQRAREKHERPIESIADLPPNASKPIQIGHHHGLPLNAYPALRASNEARVATSSSPSSSSSSSLSLHLFPSPEDAGASSANGIATLIEHELRRELAWIQSDLKEVAKLGPVAIAFSPLDKLEDDVYEHIRQTLRTHDLDTLDPDAISETVEQARTVSKTLLYKTLDHCKAILEKRQALIVQPKIAKTYRADIDRIVPPDFLRHTPHHILTRLPVYLAAIEKRAAKQAQNPARDAQRAKQLATYRNRLAQLQTQNSEPSAQNPITQLRFQIEEFAISLFAQELGTAYPISAKKLDEAFAAANAKKPSPNSSIHPSPLTTHHSTPPDAPTQADLQSLKKLFS